MRALQSELASLEVELADPSNPLLAREREVDNVDPGELIRGLVDVRGRLEKISKGKEGRGRLVSAVMGDGDATSIDKNGASEEAEADKAEAVNINATDARSVIEMDRRVGELEKLVGSSNTALDEVCYQNFLSIQNYNDICADYAPSSSSITPDQPAELSVNTANPTTSHRFDLATTKALTDRSRPCLRQSTT